MGCYINPQAEDKRAFLIREGSVLQFTPTASDITKTSVPVCLVDNGLFTAGAVAYSAGELAAFTRPDGRSKTWYLVPRSALYQVSDLKNYE